MIEDHDENDDVDDDNSNDDTLQLTFLQGHPYGKYSRNVAERLTPSLTQPVIFPG